MSSDTFESIINFDTLSYQDRKLLITINLGFLNNEKPGVYDPKCFFTSESDAKEFINRWKGWWPSLKLNIFTEVRLIDCLCTYYPEHVCRCEKRTYYGVSYTVE
jgi:hypothetical protein